MIPSTEAARAISFHRQDRPGGFYFIRPARLEPGFGTAGPGYRPDRLHGPRPGRGPGPSLAQPGRKVLVLDCDATLRTDLGALPPSANPAPKTWSISYLPTPLTCPPTAFPWMRWTTSISRLWPRRGLLSHLPVRDPEELFIGLEEVMRRRACLRGGKGLHDQDLPPFPERSMAEGWSQVRETLLAGDQESSE